MVNDEEEKEQEEDEEEEEEGFSPRNMGNLHLAIAQTQSPPKRNG